MLYGSLTSSPTSACQQTGEIYIFQCDVLNTNRKVEIAKLKITFMVIYRRPIQRNIMAFPRSVYFIFILFFIYFILFYFIYLFFFCLTIIRASLVCCEHWNIETLKNRPVLLTKFQPWLILQTRITATNQKLTKFLTILDWHRLTLPVMLGSQWYHPPCYIGVVNFSITNSNLAEIIAWTIRNR